MLKKETFVDVIQLIRKQEKINEKITEALDLICEGSGFFYDGGRFYCEALLKVLRESMGDYEDFSSSWIDWWLYESWNGDHDAWDEDGNKIKLETAEDLYDFLVELKKEREKLDEE